MVLLSTRTSDGQDKDNSVKVSIDFVHLVVSSAFLVFNEGG